jgi:molybdate transport system substrate-binding protein
VRAGALKRAVCALALALGLGGEATAQAQRLQVYAAGSLRAAMTELIARSGLPPGTVAPPVFGPAGTLADTISAGAPADLFASADVAQPRRLAMRGQAVVVFAHNRLCAYARPSVGLAAANILDRLLDPSVRVATSRPGADPSGDYAQAVFEMADRLRRGAAGTLTAKAIRLGGSARTPSASGNPPADLFLADRIDVLLSYCSGASGLQKAAPGVVATPLPPALSPPVDFGMVVLSPNPLAARLAAFMLSPRGQAILVRNGFTAADASAR